MIKLTKNPILPNCLVPMAFFGMYNCKFYHFTHIPGLSISESMHLPCRNLPIISFFGNVNFRKFEFSDIFGRKHDRKMKLSVVLHGRCIDYYSSRPTKHKKRSSRYQIANSDFSQWQWLIR